MEIQRDDIGNRQGETEGRKEEEEEEEEQEQEQTRNDKKKKKKDEVDDDDSPLTFSTSCSPDRLIAMRRLDLMSQARFITNRAAVFNAWINDTVTTLAVLASILTLALIGRRSLSLFEYVAVWLLGCIAGVIVYGTAIRILLNGSRRQPAYTRILRMSPAQLRRYVRCLQDVNLIFHAGSNEHSLSTILKQPWQKHAEEINYREDDPVHEAAEKEEEEATQAVRAKYNI